MRAGQRGGVGQELTGLPSGPERLVQLSDQPIGEADGHQHPHRIRCCDHRKNPGFPLWGGTDNDRWIETSDPAKALAAGLKIRPFADTIRDTLAWTRVSAPPDGIGLSPDREAALLEAT
jgi:hypothetical protein